MDGRGVPRYEGYVALPGPEGKQASVNFEDLKGLTALMNSTEDMLRIAGDISQGRANLQAQETLIQLEGETNGLIERLQQNHDPEEWDDMFNEFRQEAIGRLHNTIRSPQGQRIFNERSEIEMEKFRHGLTLHRISREQEIGRTQTMTIAEHHVEAGDYEKALQTIIEGIERNYFHRSQGTQIAIDVQRRAYMKKVADDVQAAYDQYGFEAAMGILQDPSTFSETYIDEFPLADGRVMPQGSDIRILDERGRESMIGMLNDMHSANLQEQKRQRAISIDQIDRNLNELALRPGFNAGTLSLALRSEFAKALYDTDYETAGPILDKWQQRHRSLLNQEAAGESTVSAQAREFLTNIQLLIPNLKDINEKNDLMSFLNEGVEEIGPRSFGAGEVARITKAIEDQVINIASQDMTRVLERFHTQAYALAPVDRETGEKLISLDQEARFTQAAQFIEEYVVNLRESGQTYDAREAQRLMAQFLRIPVVGDIIRDTRQSVFSRAARGEQLDVERVKEGLQTGAYSGGMWADPRIRRDVDAANQITIQDYLQATGRDFLIGQAFESYSVGGRIPIDEQLDSEEEQERKRNWPIEVYQTPDTGQMLIRERLQGGRERWVAFQYEDTRRGLFGLGGRDRQLVPYEWIPLEGSQHPVSMNQIDFNTNNWRPIEVQRR